MKRNYLEILVILILLVACKQSVESGMHKADIDYKKVSMSVIEFRKWVESSDFVCKAEKVIEPFKFSVTLQPAEYLTLKELNKNSVTKKEYDSVLSLYDKMQYFVFVISATEDQQEMLKVGIDNRYDYNKRVDYFSFRIQNDLQLEYNNEKIPCSICHFERTYGVSPNSTFFLGFPLTNGMLKLKSLNKDMYQHDLTFVYNDQILDVGMIKMVLNADDLNNKPSLKIIE